MGFMSCVENIILRLQTHEREKILSHLRGLFFFFSSSSWQSSDICQALWWWWII